MMQQQLKISSNSQTPKKSSPVTAKHWWCNDGSAADRDASQWDTELVSVGTCNRCVQVKSAAGQSVGRNIHILNKKCWSKCRYKDTNILPYTKMHKCKDMCRYNSAGQSMGTKLQLYLQIQRCKIRGYVQNLHYRYKSTTMCAGSKCKFKDTKMS